MSRSGLIAGVAAVLGATGALLAIFGLLYNPILLGAALPFGAATYLLWRHASGRVVVRTEERPRSSTRWRGAANRPPPDRRGHTRSGEAAEAARVVGVEPDADEATLRRAFRRRAREVHPDAPDGDEAAFRRLRAAYERLRVER